MVRYGLTVVVPRPEDQDYSTVLLALSTIPDDQDRDDLEDRIVPLLLLISSTTHPGIHNIISLKSFLC